jgi:hypothetical protein
MELEMLRELQKYALKMKKKKLNTAHLQILTAV